jgi:Rnl2 family RNA ligase
MFKRYTSIDNHYQQKVIDFFQTINPDLPNLTYSLTEKLDGANISIVIGECGKIQYTKRNNVLAPGEDFYKINSLKETINKAIVEPIFKWMKEQGYQFVQLYGEIYGKGIQKRINYGDGINVKFFDLRINGNEFLTPAKLNDLFHSLSISEWLVRTIDIVDGLNNVLEYNVDIKNEYGSMIEGFVIKPHNVEIVSPVGDRFVLKKKNEKFQEKCKVKKEILEADEDVLKYNQIFRTYINENRVLSTISKLGPIENQKQIGQYVKCILDDAKDDFLKENTLPNKFTNNDVKQVFNVGSAVFNLLKHHL